MIRRKWMITFIAVMVGVGALTSMPASANLAISPTLVMLEGRQRTTDLNLINTSNEPQTYEISWKYIRMEEGTGDYTDSATSTTQFDVPSNVVFTPRRVVVPPKGAQRVRFALRLKGEQPPAGDYRAHVVLTNKPNALTENADVGPGETEMGVKMTFGFSIPFVYRVGSGDGAANIGNISTEINPKTNKIDAVIPVTRDDNGYGIFGAILVNYNGKTIGQLANANIFPEVKSRLYKISLNAAELSGGELEVIYKHHDRANKKVYDRKIVKIGQ